MTIIRSLFKALKITSEVTTAGLEQFNKGMDGINKSLEDLNTMQKIMQETKIAYSAQKDLIYYLSRITEFNIEAAKKAEEHKIWLASMTPEDRKTINSLLSQTSYSGTFGTALDLDENKRDSKPWPVMKNPVTNDPVFQAKADLEFAELQAILEREYSGIKQKCERDKVFSEHFKKQLIRANCPGYLIEKMIPDYKPGSVLTN